MGATSFAHRTEGESVNEAFAKAVEEAYWLHGHGGYTGSIAEKSGYIVFDVPLNDLSYQEVQQECWNSTTNKYEPVMVPSDPINRLVEAIWWYSERMWEWNDDRSGIQRSRDPFAQVDPPYMSHYYKSMNDDEIAREKQRAENNKADARFFHDRMGKKKWEELVEQYQNKWDEAVAIHLGNGEWLFCGMASC